MSRYMYLAYGSNLNLAQMGYRCPGAQLIAVGFLKGYELIFKGRPGSAFCTIRKDNGMKTPVGIWLISDANLYALDRYEGYPTHYRKETIEPNKLLITGKKYSGFEMAPSIVYIMNSGRLGAPSQQYYSTVAEGYRNCGLDIKYLEAAYARSVKK